MKWIIRIIGVVVGVALWMEQMNWFIVCAIAGGLLLLAHRIGEKDVERSNEGNSTVAGFMLPVVLIIGAVILILWYAFSHGHHSPYGGLQRFH